MRSCSAHRRAGIAVLVLGIILLAAFAVSAADTDLFTSKDVARQRVVSSAVISPDGNRVAYTLSVPRDPFNEDDGPAWAELHVVDANGVSRPYVTGKVNVGGIQWTPDGKGISFAAKRDGDDNRVLYLLPVDGGEAQRIVVHPADVGLHAWSPDGKQVAFLATPPPTKKQKDLRKKGFSQQVYEEDKKLQQVWIHTLTDPDTLSRALELPGSVTVPQWSPDGKRLALALAPTSLTDDDYMKRKVHVVDAATGGILARFDNPGKLGQIRWSPDGRNLAIVSAADYNDPAAGRLMVAPATGGALRDLLPGFEGDVGALDWRDARTIVALIDQGVWTYIVNIGLDGKPMRALVPPAVSQTPAKIGQPEDGAVFTSFSLSRDGKNLALTGNSWQHPAEVYLQRAGENRPRRLTDSNPWLAQRRLAKQEVVTYKARDGLLLDGILIRPLDEKPGQRYPLVLQVHGGPEAHNINGWLTSYGNVGQVGAARGLAVFYPNYRGGTGRGVAFSKLGQADPAGKEFDDLVDAVDHFIAVGLADSARIGITGGSYGGYASAWASTYYSNRFAASVMAMGISNKISKLGTTDIPNEEIGVHALKPVWEDWEHALSRSPIYYADRSHTPTLILLGTDDPRVNPGQGREMYRHLKMRGQAPVRLVMYPGEQHGNSRAAARLDYNLRMLQWLEHYLKGPGGDPPPYEIEYE